MTEFEGWLSTREAAELTGYSVQYVCWPYLPAPQKVRVIFGTISVGIIRIWKAHTLQFQ